MARESHTPEQIIDKLHEVDVALARVERVVEVVWQIGVTEQACCHRRNEYGGLSVDQARHLKQINKENAPLRRAVADLALQNQILKEAPKCDC